MSQYQEKKQRQKSILVGLHWKGNETFLDIESSMEELSELTIAAGSTVLGLMIQNALSPNPATYIGKGKVEELVDMVNHMEANLVIFNDELSGSQIRNLEEQIGVQVIDRTTLILDIFARRAQSKVAKLQVELAQLKYRLPRLSGMGESLSKTGAGIGTRGPGEQKLEIDRRRIREKISDISRQIKDAEKIRQTQRAQRVKNQIPIVALVGYTNAGKSTLMNRLISMSIDGDKEKMVFTKDMLFATLDTTNRRVELSEKKPFVLVDTVGFVSQLPHELVKAFQATLEEVVQADLIIQVVDGTTDFAHKQMEVTNRVLEKLGAGNRPQILVYNKMDLVDKEQVKKTKSEHFLISAKTGTGVDDLIKDIEKEIFKGIKPICLLIPFEAGNIYAKICDSGRVIHTEYLSSGTKVKVELNEKDREKYKCYKEPCQ